MAKHTLQQTHQDLLGQYNTENADLILENYKDVVKGKKVQDPFAGQWHLLDWAEREGALSSRGYDIELLDNRTQYNDYFQSPVEVEEGEVVVTNPPYLSRNRNKKGDRTPYDRYNQNDYYKCYLASIVETKAEEVIVIIPGNFLCESRTKAREALFKDYYIQSGEYWTESIFDGVEISICTLHLKRGNKPYQEFPMLQRPSGISFEMKLLPENGYRHGEDFFREISEVELVDIKKVEIGDNTPNTNIVVSLLDKGKHGLGLYYNTGEPIYCSPSSFTTYQISLPFTLTEEEQKEVVETYNRILNTNREKYHSMFLGFYIDAKQRIMNRTFVNKLLSKVLFMIKRAGTS